ncbi:unnamed protein product [Bursaphelenchus xylophilus]|uniref:(pine wood nematode) hypothetical protein n=1 Tax=Bursaphelenchus xylophilus TaxID=6326 RepID=A0A1I7SX02_BURXY|nr:unnamed protein product [Bursaphelenchus xylophilus]CAG9100084.1 unnamed protein product [Bursaphelenchus xylophilus]
MAQCQCDGILARAGIATIESPDFTPRQIDCDGKTNEPATMLQLDSAIQMQVRRACRCCETNEQWAPRNDKFFCKRWKGRSHCAIPLKTECTVQSHRVEFKESAITSATSGPIEKSESPSGGSVAARTGRPSSPVLFVFFVARKIFWGGGPHALCSAKKTPAMGRGKKERGRTHGAPGRRDGNSEKGNCTVQSAVSARCDPHKNIRSDRRKKRRHVRAKNNDIYGQRIIANSSGVLI